MTLLRPFRFRTASLALSCSLLLAGALLVEGCHRGGVAKSATPPATRPEAMRAYVSALAGFGEKAVGSEAGAAAAGWILREMAAIGLEDPHFEEFSFPYNAYRTYPLTITLGGQTQELTYDVLEASGGTAGSGLRAELAYVNIGAPEDFLGRDLVGKIVVLKRDENYDRSVQLQNAIAAHAAAMIYVSQAPGNLRQVGTVRHTFEPSHPIPALSIGRQDGQALIQALQAGTPVSASVRLDVTLSPLDTPGRGRNVIGRITGEDARRMILVSAHYDSWKAGASDNASGVAGILGVARRELARYRQLGRKPRYTLVFIAYDGEEIDLYGGYDYLRRHVFTPDPQLVLASVNLEMPVGADRESQATYPDTAQPTWSVIHSRIAVLEQTLAAVGGRLPAPLYPKLQGIDDVARISGGIIATDIQPHFRAGIPTLCTWTGTPWYHTSMDDPEHVDYEFLARSVDYFGEILYELMAHAPSEFAEVDSSLLRARVTPGLRSSTQEDLVVEVEVTGLTGQPVRGVPLTVELLVRDFFPAWSDATGKIVTDASGRARFTVPAAALNLAPDGRFLDVTGGKDYPVVEVSAPVLGP